MDPLSPNTAEYLWQFVNIKPSDQYPNQSKAMRTQLVFSDAPVFRLSMDENMETALQQSVVPLELRVVFKLGDYFTLLAIQPNRQSA